MERSSAVLMHLTSLPGPFGIGTMGEDAKRFAVRLAEAGFTYWQVLPLLEPSEDSPYQSFSAFAGYTALIDPREMVRKGLLDQDEIADFYYHGSTYSVDYSFAKLNSERYLKRAFSKLTAAIKDEVERFSKTVDWLEDYALFMCIRSRYGDVEWSQWPDEALRTHDFDALQVFKASHREQIDYIKFSQWLFWDQWHDLKAYINSLGLQIFGDIAFYVATDSVEVWANPQNFLLDEDLMPTVVAGVPPDYFAAEGQLWGNAIYDWAYMEKTAYRWWISRIAASLDLYDLLRIDHFRGFEAYWAVPAGSETAINGSWQEGPGMKLFNRVRETLGHVNIVAEDLGQITDGVRELLAESEFPGMMVMQFAFQPESDGTSLPHHYKKNLCAYTGTHDNDTLLGWLWGSSDAERAKALDYIDFPTELDWSQGGVYSRSVRAFIKHLWSTPADFVCAPIQDFLGFGTDTRMNIPGVEEGQWRFRLTYEAFDQLDVHWIRHINKLYERFNYVVRAREEETVRVRIDDSTVSEALIDDPKPIVDAVSVAP